MAIEGTIVRGPSAGYGTEPFDFEGQTVSAWVENLDDIEIAAVLGHKVATGYMIDKVIHTWDNAAQFGASAMAYHPPQGTPGIGAYLGHLVDEAKVLLPVVYPKNLGVPVVQNDTPTNGPDGLVIINRLFYQWSQFAELPDHSLDVQVRGTPKTT